MGAGAKIAVILVVLFVFAFFIPVVSVSSSQNYVVASSSATIYESLSLNLFHCGGYYLTQSSSSFGQGSGSSGYGFFCNASTNTH